MFLFNKNNDLPDPKSSVESSVESLVVSPSLSASTSEVWVSQSPDASSYAGIPSPEQRGRQYSGKRSSVFNLRSRSNTATSTTSSFVSISPSMARPDSSHRSSQDLRHLTGNILDLPGSKRSLFTRGKRGKRISEHFSHQPNREDSEEVDVANKRTSVLRKTRMGVHQSEGSMRNLKHRISSPFDFQHLTHTDRHQFSALEETSEHDLVAEFWAVSASQAPRRDLNGIKADDLHFNNFSSENLTVSQSRSMSALSSASPPHSPGPSRERQQSEPMQPALSGNVLRVSRSVESFSQPGTNFHAHRHTQSVAAPPRVSSRLPLASIKDVPEESTNSQTFPLPPRLHSNRQSGIWDKFAPMVPAHVGEPLATAGDDPSYIGHALTTPDESAIHPITPPFSPGLEDVAEEPERFVSPRPAPRPPVKSPKSPRSPLFESFSFRGAQRSPITRTHSRNSSYTSPKSLSQRTPMTRPLSQTSDTLGSPTQTRRSSVRRSHARGNSNTWRVIEESWEDDIDYIYENALEADCDFDWDRSSIEETFEDRDRTPEQRDHERPRTAVTQPSLITHDEDPPFQGDIFASTFRPSLLVPSPSNVPELESRSAVSTSTADTGIQTPSDFFSMMHHQHDFKDETENYHITATLLSPPDIKEAVSREEMYDSILADYEGSDRHFPFIDASQSFTSSERNSHVRFSKRSSYDSSLMSSGQGSASWSSPVRRSASSSGSLPELVHSRRTRRDLSITVDQLSEQVASFSSFDENDTEEKEDDEVTPPGRLSQDRAFFASNDEDDYTQKVRTSIEGEVRASLELARQGSQRAARAPLHYHRYASSDGVAKLLPSAISATPELQETSKSRSRAASSSNAARENRQAYLSLFPSPPKHTPLQSPISPKGN